MTDQIQCSVTLTQVSTELVELLREPGWFINDGKKLRNHVISEFGDKAIIIDEEHGSFEFLILQRDDVPVKNYPWRSQFYSVNPSGPGGTTVTFDITQEQEFTLTVTESGFETLGLGAEELAKLIDGNTEAWNLELGLAAGLAIS